MKLAELHRIARAEVLRQFPHLGEPDTDPADLDAAINEQIDDWRVQAAEEVALYGGPEDSPCIESCDRWGTGEGRYHGLIA